MKISEEEKIEFLKELVSIYSPSGKEEDVAKFLTDSFESFGVESYTDEVGNVIAEKDGKGSRVLLAGHMDTVPGIIPIRVEGDYLWGRGSVDAKGPLAAFFFAFLESKGNLIFAGLVDEEGYSLGAKNLDVPKPDFIIIGEPSGLNGITIAYKGSLTMRLVEKVEKFHGSLSSKGAAEKLIEQWLEISKNFGNGFNVPTGRILRFEAYERDFDFYGEMVVNIRTPPNYLPPIKGEVLDFVPAYEVSPRSPLVRAFVRAIRSSGLKPVLKKKSGTADMNILAPRFEVDAIAYGPGDSKLDHTPYERLSLKEYLGAIRTLETAIEELNKL